MAILRHRGVDALEAVQLPRCAAEPILPPGLLRLPGIAAERIRVARVHHDIAIWLAIVAGKVEKT